MVKERVEAVVIDLLEKVLRKRAEGRGPGASARQAAPSTEGGASKAARLVGKAAAEALRASSSLDHLFDGDGEGEGEEDEFEVDYRAMARAKLDEYQKEGFKPVKLSQHPLKTIGRVWAGERGVRFPEMAVVCRAVLSVMGSSGNLERDFCKSATVLSAKRGGTDDR